MAAKLPVNAIHERQYDAFYVLHLLEVVALCDRRCGMKFAELSDKAALILHGTARTTEAKSDPGRIG